MLLHHTVQRTMYYISTFSHKNEGGRVDKSKHSIFIETLQYNNSFYYSVGDPDPDPEDPGTFEYPDLDPERAK